MLDVRCWMFDVFTFSTMSDHDHQLPPLETQDAGSQALTEALRSSFVIVKFAMVALVFVILGAGFFTVGPQEKAVILRFGKPQGEGQKMLLGAGLHWSLPYPIDEVVRIPITEIQQVRSTVGWYATTPEMELAGTEPPAGPSLNPQIDGYVITRDREKKSQPAAQPTLNRPPFRRSIRRLSATASLPTATRFTAAPRFRITLTTRARPSSISPAAPIISSTSPAFPTPCRTPRTTP